MMRVGLGMAPIRDHPRFEYRREVTHDQTAKLGVT